MSTASKLNPSSEDYAASPSLQHPRPLSSVVASARRITSGSLRAQGKSGKSHSWQDDAWDMYDRVGEHHFLTTTLANRTGQANLYVGEVGEDTTAIPKRTEDEVVSSALSTIGSGPLGLSSIITRLALNLLVAGEGWLIGIPSAMLEDENTDHTAPPPISEINAIPAKEELDLKDLEWRILSISEIAFNRAGELTISTGESENIKCKPDDVYLIRIWKSHPRYAWLPDSSTFSSLPVLRELVGLTMHISAQVDSRLAGAGLLLVPSSASEAMKASAGIDLDSDDDPFTDSLMEAMMTPIRDRDNASAVVPLIATVPDESTSKFVYMTFAKPLDTEARELRDEAIRRLALGQDAPPELLLGSGAMNHWGAWLVREDVVTTHIEPPLAMICDALTTQYLWPVLMNSYGMSEDQAKKYVVWYDVSHMVMRPNRAKDAMSLYEAGVVSEETLRISNGFTEIDAPAKPSPEVAMVRQIILSQPSLLESFTVAELLAQMRLLSDDLPAPTPSDDDEPSDETIREGDLPDTADDDMPEPDESNA